MRKKIRLNNQNFKPQGDYSYILAKNGIFLIKENSVYSAQIKLKKSEIPKLDKLEEKFELRIRKKIPYTEIQKVIQFFRVIREIYGREAIAIIYYHPQKEEFKFFIPFQRASSGHVQTEENIVEQDGFFPIGTIHSHPGAPFHSDGDQEDEKEFSGIHITCGNLGKENPDWVASLVIHGRRIQLNPEEIMELKIEYPKEWFKKISDAIRVERMFYL